MSRRTWCPSRAVPVAGVALAVSLVLSFPLAAAAPAGAARSSAHGAATSPSTRAATTSLDPSSPHFSNSIPLLPRGSVKVGPMAASTPIHLDVSLMPADHQKLTALLGSLYTPGSPQYHHYLAPGQFAQQFGAPTTVVDTVRSTLSADGMSVGNISSNGLILPVDTNVGTAESVFGTSLAQYRLADGKTAFANTTTPTVPTAIKPFVQGIVGLDSASVPQPLVDETNLATHAVGPAQLAATGTCPIAAVLATRANGYTTTTLFDHYGFNAATFPAGISVGAGQTIALFELEGYVKTDLSNYEACYTVNNLPINPTVNVVPVDGGTNLTGKEATLDTEITASLVPGTTINVYEAPPTATATIDEYTKIVSDDTSQVVSTSWGSCESNTEQATIQTENNLFEQAAAQGQTVLAASGDSGSEGCAAQLPTGVSANTQLAVDDPASQPYVTAVGGTSYTSSFYVSPATEGAWTNGGGGISTIWQMPAWQQGFGVVNSYSSGAPCGAATGTYCREVPDVAAAADSARGYVIFVNGNWQAGIGGTSAAAPLWGAFVAEQNQGCKANADPPTGFADPRLYALAQSGSSVAYATNVSEANADTKPATYLYNTFLTGNNDSTGSNSGAYPTYDPTNPQTRDFHYSMATGLGTPTANLFAPVGGGGSSPGWLCNNVALPPTVTSVGPISGSPGGGATVTITGNNFTGVTDVHFGSVSATSFRVFSDTLIEAMSPPGPAGTTVDVTVTEGTTSSSPDPPYDSFTYTSGPTVKNVNASYGPNNGGATVTISGSGFTGATAVQFFTGRQSACMVHPPAAPPPRCSLSSPSFAVSSDSSIVATTPSDSNVTQYSTCDLTDVLVTTPNGTSFVNSGNNVGSDCPPASSEAAGPLNTGDEYAFTNLPIVTSISVKSGPMQGHVPMTIMGDNFSGATGVAFGNPQVLGLNFRLVSDKQISVDAPPVQFPGTVDLSVESPLCGFHVLCSPAVRADQFTYVSCGASYLTTSINSMAVAGSGTGFLLSDSSGRISACGTAQYYGSAVDPYQYNVATQPPSFGFPIVGVASSPSNSGYWEADSEGHVYPMGSAGFFGDASKVPLAFTIVGIAATPDGRGYWLAESDGGVFAYGDARFFGSAGNLRLNKPVIGIAATPDGEGYWLVASDGGIFTYGDAGFYGSTGNIILNQPIVGIASSPSGAGYWMVASDGGIFAFGDAPFHGSAYTYSQINIPIGGSVVAIAPTPDGGGYWMTTTTGNVLNFGDAPYEGTAS